MILVIGSLLEDLEEYSPELPLCMQRRKDYMLDTKEIQYFVACAQTGSFSRAAETLYTTQSSVSKIVKAMEEKMGIMLFDRLSKGIRMTPEAEKMYPYAFLVLDNLEKIQSLDENKAADTLSMSCNPSSWFADNFVRFYEQKQNEDIHYQIHSADCREIVERVRERMDDVGFVYIMKNQSSAFQYYVSRNYLEFIPLKETSVTVYHGEGCCRYESSEADLDFSSLKLIQRFPDEFSPDNYWNITDSNGRTAAEAETVITTNSDYIMERILQFGNLANISGEYLSGKPQREVSKGQLLPASDTRILFGYVKRKGEELSKLADGFLNFLISNLSH